MQETARRIAARLRGGFYALQAFGIVLWWAVMFNRPSTIRAFLPASVVNEALTAFLPADAVLALASIVAARLAFRVHPRERPAAWFVAGAACYATLWCAGIWAQTGEALAGVLFMLPCALASLCCAMWANRS